jgi:signal transduction histidine kinase
MLQTVVSAASSAFQSLRRRLGLAAASGSEACGRIVQPTHIRESEARLRLSREVYWECDLQGRLTHVGDGPHAAAVALSQRLGRCPWDDDALPLDDPDWSAHRERLARGEPFSEFGWVWNDASGRPHVCIDSGEPRRDTQGALIGYMGLSRDAGAQVAADRARRLATAALLAARDPVLWIEAHARPLQGWRIVWANAAACRLFDRTERELRDLPDRTLFGPHASESAMTIDRCLREYTDLRCHTDIARKYGAVRRIDLRLEPLPGSPSLRPCAALLLQDLTESLEAQTRDAQERDAALAHERARMQALQATARELDAFTYSVSHDLRAPIRVIEGFARILQEDYGDRLDSVGHDHLQRILSGATRMTQMLEALLNLARLSGQPLSLEQVDLSRLADAVAEELRVLEPARRCMVTVQPGMQASGDRMLLRAVLTNLIGNAWKYTGKVEQARIGIDRTGEGAHAVYCVRDNGAGFDMRHADRLFGVFQRLHRDADFEGTGVGLATVQRIVKRHGGRIWAESAPGQGSRFYFTLGTDESTQQPATAISLLDRAA